MATLNVIRIKPNPSGKDRNRYGADPAQLGAEWVDIRNWGSAAVDLTTVELNHLAYSEDKPQSVWQAITVLKAWLQPGQVLRVHSGQHRNIAILNSADLLGADLHTFTGRDAYVWNNAEGDCAALWNRPQATWIDRACYDPNPPEGFVLHRVGDKLVPQ